MTELADKKIEEEIATLKAERRAYDAEANFHELQAQRLERARANEDAELEAQRIYDFTAGVDFPSVRTAINTLTEWEKKSHDPITIRFLTPGGDVIAGLALYDYLRLLRGENDDGIEITTMAIGMVASMGAVLLQAGTHRVITPSAWVMIHEVAGELSGGRSEMEDASAWQGKIQDQLLEALAERSTLTKQQIARRWKRKNWWMDSADAIKLGFADTKAVGL